MSLNKYKTLLSLIGVIMSALFIITCFWLLNTGFYTENVEKNSYTQKDSELICKAIKFELGQNESISTVYFPGVLQASPFLEVQIHNVDFKNNDFLKRFKGMIKLENVNGAYDIEMFTFESVPKDYSNRLEFNPNENTATFKIDGYIPELTNIYKMADDPIQPFLHNTPLIVSVILEIISLCFFTIIFIVYKRKNRLSQNN